MEVWHAEKENCKVQSIPVFTSMPDYTQQLRSSQLHTHSLDCHTETTWPSPGTLTKYRRRKGCICGLFHAKNTKKLHAMMPATIFWPSDNLFHIAFNCWQKNIVTSLSQAVSWTLFKQAPSWDQNFSLKALKVLSLLNKRDYHLAARFISGRARTEQYTAIPPHNHEALGA